MIRKKRAPGLDRGVGRGFPKKSCSNKYAADPSRRCRLPSAKKLDDTSFIHRDLWQHNTSLKASRCPLAGSGESVTCNRGRATAADLRCVHLQASDFFERAQ